MGKRYARSLLLLLSAVAAGASAPMAQAQYQYLPPGGPGYYPPGYGPGNYVGSGGYWYGQAAILDAYGDLGKSQEQARILREQANQAKLVTKKQTIDYMAYERANKYWWSDEQADIQQKQIQAAMNKPPIQEITSGRALNTLLPFVDGLLSSGKRGPTVPIDPDIVKQINVTTGQQNGNVGLFKEINNLPWPTATLGPTQEKLDEMLKKAAYDAAKGPLSPTAISQLNKTTDVVAEEVKKKFHKSEIDGGDYLDGNRFLDRVRQSITALKQPGVAKMLSGVTGPQGDTVDEVVYSMASKGLTFAPCLPGYENAYVAVHRAFVNFVTATEVPDTGFRMRVGGGASTSKAQDKK